MVYDLEVIESGGLRTRGFLSHVFFLLLRKLFEALSLSQNNITMTWCLSRSQGDQDRQIGNSPSYIQFIFPTSNNLRRILPNARDRQALSANTKLAPFQISTFTIRWVLAPLRSLQLRFQSLT